MNFILPTEKVITKEEFLTMGTRDYRTMIFELFVKTGLFVERTDTGKTFNDEGGLIPPLQGGNEQLEKEQGEPGSVEILAAKFHEIYQVEAERQGDVRHQKDYEDLPENIKEYDRALARYVLANFEPKNKF